MPNKNSAPKISVVMPVYNCDKYLEEALASLLIQTFTDFEIIAINDGSTDGSLEILEKFAKIDDRIRIINQKNTGIVKVLNRGLDEARAEYIARMDGDDVCFPNRFSDQIKILDNNPDIALVAGNFEVINEASEFLYRDFVIPDDQCIQLAFYLRNAIAHGSVMFRKSIVKELGGYSDKCGPTEDMELWMRLLKDNKFTATDSFVYKWRVNQKGITSQNNAQSRARAEEHLKTRWSQLPPTNMSKKDISRISNRLLIDFAQNGPQYRNMFILDLSSIAIKTFFIGSKKQAIYQFLEILTSGKKNFKLATGQLFQMAKRLLKRHL